MSALVVEDNPVTGSGIADMLRRNGWRAEWATGVQDAVAKLKIFDPDLVVLDLGLKDGDGRDLLRQSWSKQRRVVVLTGAPDEDVKALAAEFPGVAVMQKPVDPADLLALVGRGRKA